MIRQKYPRADMINSKIRIMNDASIYLHHWYYFRSKEKNFWLFWIFILINTHLMRFTCSCSAWKKYLNLFKVMLIVFYLIFDPCMNHIEDLKKDIPSSISSSGNICSMKLGILEALFVSPFSELSLLEHFSPWFSAF